MHGTAVQRHGTARQCTGVHGGARHGTAPSKGTVRHGTGVHDYQGTVVVVVVVVVVVFVVVLVAFYGL